MTVDRIRNFWLILDQDWQWRQILQLTDYLTMSLIKNRTPPIGKDASNCLEKVIKISDFNQTK